MTIIGQYDSPGYVEEVRVLGQYAYLADGPDGVRVVDVTDRYHPVEVSALYSHNYAFDLEVVDEYVYIASAGAGLLVANIFDPLNPAEAGKLNTPGYAFRITLSGNTAYVADGWEGLRIIDISSPYQPIEIGTYKTEGWAFDIALSHSTLYLADSFSALQVLDITVPNQPVKMGAYAMLGDHVNRISLSAGTVYIASRNKGLVILDASTRSSPRQAGGYNPMGYVTGVEVSGQFAYVAAGFYGLRIVDISDLSRPREVGAYDTRAHANFVVVEGSYAYVVTSSAGESTPAGIHVLDISDPTRPRLLTFHVGINSSGDGLAKNGVLFVADEEGVEAIDISNPAAPYRLSQIDFSGGDHALMTHATSGVSLSGNRAYVTRADFGIEIVDISNPGNMKWVGSFKSAAMNSVYAVTVAGNYAYVSDVSSLHILNISDPDHPVAVGTFPLSVATEKMAYANNRLYLANTAGGLIVLDVSVPQTPVLLGQRRLPGNAHWVSLSSSHIFVADREGGLYIVEDTANPVQAGQPTFAPSEGPETRVVSFPHSAGEKKNLPASPILQPVSTMPATMPASPESTPSVEMTFDLYLPIILKLPSLNIMVSSAANSGPGSLREAVEAANQNTGGSLILFDSKVFPPHQPATIYLLTGLPGLVAGNTTIDASNAGVILDGSLASQATGLDLVSHYNTIRGLQIVNFPGFGIHITGAGNIIGGDRQRGSGPMGEGNLISGNEGVGVALGSVSAVGNRVIGNYIGTDITGTQAMGNAVNGVFIGDGASLNVIGGESEADRNVISGNVRTEVSIFEGGNRNKIIGNYISTTADGSARLGNAVMGFSIEMGGFSNLIQSNVFGSSVVVADYTSWGNSIIGNFVGIDPTGTTAIGGGGVSVGAFNRIGGTNPSDRNIISGGTGIFVGGSNTNIFVLGNYIGTDITGTKAVGNGVGVAFYQGVQHIFVGGPTLEERNLISGNTSNGISMEGYGNDNNFIRGNIIGADISGKIALPNGDAGILIDYGEHNFIQGNLIANQIHPAVHVRYGAYNRFHHNSFVNNNAFDSGTNNQWDDGREGNFWYDYQGSDANGDGIGDTPYMIQSNGADRFPLMKNDLLSVLPR